MRTYREILEGCKYHQDSIKGKGKGKRVAKRMDEEQPTLPFAWNEDLKKIEEKERKDHD